MAIIEVKDFSKYYGKFLAVDGISLSVEKGEIVGFVGKNGAGKSTLIRSMMNMIFPSAGEILIDGLDSIRSSKEIKQFVGYMPSESEFYDGLRVKELFRFCLRFTDETFDRVIRLAEFFELDLEKRVSELSLGNRKKVSIIQALLKRSRILILDEPTSGLDPLMQKNFFDMILEEKKKGVTVFLSSHNLNEIERYCDRVAIIKDGRIVDFLVMDEVKKQQRQWLFYVTEDGEEFNAEIRGNINDEVQKLSKLKLRSLEIRNKTVEEEFMGYYENTSQEMVQDEKK